MQFAEAVGISAERVAKTLLLRVCQRRARVHRPHAAVLLAAPDRVDLDAVGAILDADCVRLASRSELQNALGVAPGAVSPFWLGSIPVHLDVSLLAESTVFVGTGAPGIELEIAPADLRDVTRATVGRYRLAAICHEPVCAARAVPRRLQLPILLIRCRWRFGAAVPKKLRQIGAILTLRSRRDSN